LDLDDHSATLFRCCWICDYVLVTLMIVECVRRITCWRNRPFNRPVVD